MSNEIGLGELITKIKEELESTNKQSATFLVDKAELELQVTVSKGGDAEIEGSAEADLKINILSVDFLKLGKAGVKGKATRKSEREVVHTIKLSLTPAILSDKFMDILDPNEKDKLQEDTKKALFQGNQQKI